MIGFDSGGNDFRYERKFEVEGGEPSLVRWIVLQHPAMFRTAYPPRWVNNVYLDTPSFDAYVDNMEGNPARAKARIRWYGEFSGTIADAILELKLKQGTVGSKLRYAMPPFTMDRRTNGRSLGSLIRSIDSLPLGARCLAAGLEEATANRYRREYYLSSDGRFRATIDYDLAFSAIGRVRGGVRASPRARSVVVIEVKYGTDADVDADRVCSWFPFRVARHSKYARGVAAAVL